MRRWCPSPSPITHHHRHTDHTAWPRRAKSVPRRSTNPPSTVAKQGLHDTLPQPGPTSSQIRRPSTKARERAACERAPSLPHHRSGAAQAGPAAVLSIPPSAPVSNLKSPIDGRPVFQGPSRPDQTQTRTAARPHVHRLAALSPVPPTTHTTPGAEAGRKRNTDHLLLHQGEEGEEEAGGLVSQAIEPITCSTPGVCTPSLQINTHRHPKQSCHPSSQPSQVRLQFPKSEWVGARRPTAAMHRHPKEPHRNATQRKPPLHIPRRPLRSFLRPWCMYVHHGGQKRRPGGACVGHGHVSILGDRCGLGWDWVT